VVLLKGLARTEFNGQRGEVMPHVAGETERGRVVVRLQNSGRTLAVRCDRVHKVDMDSSSDSDSIPPLRVLGKKETAQGRTDVLQSVFTVGEQAYLQDMCQPGYNGEHVCVLPSNPLRVHAGCVTVQLSSGRRLVLKDSNLTRELPPRIVVEPRSHSHKPSRRGGPRGLAKQSET